MRHCLIRWCTIKLLSSSVQSSPVMEIYMFRLLVSVCFRRRLDRNVLLFSRRLRVSQHVVLHTHKNQQMAFFMIYIRYVVTSQFQYHFQYHQIYCLKKACILQHVKLQR